MKLDGKFYGVVIRNKDQSVVPPDQWVVFLAKGRGGGGWEPYVGRDGMSSWRILTTERSQHDSS
jgi:hypothetical protein